MKHIITIEEEGDLQGLTAILKRVPQNYFLVNLLDRGFLRHGLGPYLLDVLDEVEQETGNHIFHFRIDPKSALEVLNLTIP